LSLLNYLTIFFVCGFPPPPQDCFPPRSSNCLRLSPPQHSSPNRLLTPTTDLARLVIALFSWTLFSRSTISSLPYINFWHMTFSFHALLCSYRLPQVGSAKSYAATPPLFPIHNLPWPIRLFFCLLFRGFRTQAPPHTSCDPPPPNPIPPSFLRRLLKSAYIFSRDILRRKDPLFRPPPARCASEMCFLPPTKPLFLERLVMILPPRSPFTSRYVFPS